MPTTKRIVNLVLKLLIEEVTASNDGQLKNLIKEVKVYVMKGNILAENIDTVSTELILVSDTIDSLSNDKLSSNSVKKLLKLLQTASVPKVNSLFQHMQDGLPIKRFIWVWILTSGIIY